VVAATGVAVLDIADGYDPLTLTSVTVTTVLAVAASGVLLAVLRRRTRRPQTVFRVLVTVGALASLGGPLSLLGSDQYPQATGPVVAWTACSTSPLPPQYWPSWQPAPATGNETTQLAVPRTSGDGA
jgi:peptidoglycan/LPS O-acetylase OafA/YrhL